MNKAVIIALGLAGWAFTCPGVARAETKCIADWTDAHQIVVREKLVDVPAIKEGFTKKNPAKILEILLCEDKGKYTYRLKLLEPAGRVRFHTLDAKKPF